MFRADKCTIKRPSKTKTKGEVIYGTPTTIYTDIPCHLSVKALSPICKEAGTGSSRNR